MSAQVLPFQHEEHAPMRVEPGTGELVSFVDGQPWVRHAGAPAAGVAARVLAHVFPPGWPRPALPCTVLLHFEGGDPRCPIIVGVVQERVPEGGTLVLDLERLVLQGHREVQLRCGEASVTMQADGRVVVKGTELVSRASATNKIRGASVQIN
jgi:hypothetical protein